MLKIIKTSQEILSVALNNLPKDYLNTLKDKPNFEESVIARYIIFKEKNILVDQDNEGKPIFNQGIFFSISHKKEIVFVGVSEKKIGVDIEIIKRRGKEIFFLHKKDEYELLGGENVENFYYLWTLKESVIKLNLSGIDELESININKINSGNYNIDGINFDLEIFGNFKEKLFIGYSKKDNDLIYSIAFEDN